MGGIDDEAVDAARSAPAGMSADQGDCIAGQFALVLCDQKDRAGGLLQIPHLPGGNRVAGECRALQLLYGLEIGRSGWTNDNRHAAQFTDATSLVKSRAWAYFGCNFFSRGGLALQRLSI